MKLYIKTIIAIFSLIIIAIVTYLILNWVIAKQIRKSQEKGIIQLEQDIFSKSFSGQIILIDKNCISLKSFQDTNEYIPPLRVLSEINNNLSVGDILIKEPNSNRFKIKNDSINIFFEFNINCY